MKASESLLQAVKDRLGITWQDDMTDRNISAIIDDGCAYIDSKIGEAADYEQAGYPRTLLMEYTRYARDEALDVFENNYLALLLAARDERQVRDYGEEISGTIQTAEQ